MYLHISFVQQTNIDEKLKNTPEGGCQVGVVIGYLLLFVGIAYYMYYRTKNRKDFD